MLKAVRGRCHSSEGSRLTQRGVSYRLGAYSSCAGQLPEESTSQKSQSPEKIEKKIYTWYIRKKPLSFTLPLTGLHSRFGDKSLEINVEPEICFWAAQREKGQAVPKLQE